jgi:hypothetical protein
MQLLVTISAVKWDPRDATMTQARCIGLTLLLRIGDTAVAGAVCAAVLLLLLLPLLPLLL